MDWSKYSNYVSWYGVQLHFIVSYLYCSLCCTISFASVTAHVTALVPIFMAIAINLLTPEQVVPFTIILAGSLG